MIEQAKWVSLTFNFDYPIGKFPALLERLRGTPSRLEEAVKGLSKEKLIKKDNDAWSIQEHVGHLIDLEDLLKHRLDDFEKGVEVLTAADMTNKKTDAANHNSRDINILLAGFRKIRSGYVQQLESYNEETVAKTALHPRLNKPMRIVDLVHFFAEHDDHHLAIMRRLINT